MSMPNKNSTPTQDARSPGPRLSSFILCLLYACSGDSPTHPADTTPPTTPYTLEIPAGFPPMDIPADNAMTVEGIALGQRLFFDPILSIDSTKACASCHALESAFSDPDAFSEGVAGRTGRNSMPLANVGWTPDLFWDGRAPSLEAQALQPVENAVEMGESWDHVVEKLERHADYPALFAQAFDAQPITADLVVKAIAQYERTLISAASKFDRVMAGAAEFTAQERMGLDLFNSEKAECFHCHGTLLLTTNAFHNNGLDEVPDDSGRAMVTGSLYDAGKFKAPTLRNVEYTAPYMHDGRFETLEEVVEFYNSGLRNSATVDPLMLSGTAIVLTPEEKAALVAFMKTLSDPAFAP